MSDYLVWFKGDKYECDWGITVEAVDADEAQRKAIEIPPSSRKWRSP